MSSTTDMTETRLQLHYAAQLLAAVGATQIEAKDDFSHTALKWHKGALWTRETPCGYRVGLRFERLRLEVEGPDEAPWVSLAGSTLDGALARLTEAIEEEYGAMSGPLVCPTHDLPDHPLAHGAAFADLSKAALRPWAVWFAHAELQLARVRSEQPNAGPVYLWPHHFDMATLINVEAADDASAGPTSDESSRTVGVGFSPGDASYPDGYWYVNMWPYPPEDKRASLPELPVGSWHTEGWVGAVLTLAEMGDDADEVAERFLKAAVAAAHAVVGRT